MRFGRGAGTISSPLVRELAAKAAEARDLCERAVGERPKDGHLHATRARRALQGDRAGALEAARAGVALGARNAQVLLGVMLAEGQGVGLVATRDTVGFPIRWRFGLE